MAICKKCGTKIGSPDNRDDGICPVCVDEEETEKRRHAFAESKEKIGLIVRNITEESPLGFTFVNWNIKKGGTFEKVSGLVLGAAVGGAVGEMAFGGSLLAERPYSGEFGILIITASQIYIGHFVAPFESKEGKIAPEYLQLFQTQFDSNNIAIKEFNIRQTQVSKSDSGIDLVCGSETVSFQKSELCVHGTIYDLPSLDDILSQLAQHEILITPTQFADKLYCKEDPISSDQFKEVENDVDYIKELVLAVARHKERDTLVRNFECLAPPLRLALEEHIRSAGSSTRGSLLKVIVSILAVAIAGAVIAPLMFDPTDGILLRAFGVFVSSFFPCLISIRFILDWRRNVWCRKIARSWEEE